MVQAPQLFHKLFAEIERGDMDCYMASLLIKIVETNAMWPHMNNPRNNPLAL
jgi:hypothetical protein